MSRARNIKPSIMANEELAELEPLSRLLFIYLWMLADREGRLEDRPKRIAANALPYDRSADVNAMLNDLQKYGFITRYSVEGVAYIQINAFTKHQNPHPREAESTIPKPNLGIAQAQPRHGSGIDIEIADSANYEQENPQESEKTQQKQEVSNEATPRHCLGNTKALPSHADSLIPHPSSLIPHPSSLPRSDKPRGALEGFEQFWNAYGKKVGRFAAEKAWQKLKPDEQLVQRICKAAALYAEATPDLQFRKAPATWLNGRHWEDEIVAPQQARYVEPAWKREQRERANEFLGRRPETIEVSAHYVRELLQ